MNKKKSLQICTFDPRPLEHRQIRSRGIEKLRCDLLQLNQSFAFSDVLVPLLDNITHDHTYSLPPTAEDVDRRVPVMKQGTSSESVESLPSFPMNDELNELCMTIKHSLTVSSQNRNQDTRSVCSKGVARCKVETYNRLDLRKDYLPKEKISITS